MNKEHDVTAENLLKSLPSVMKGDSSIMALATSVADMLAARHDEIQSILIYADIDKLPEELLDILAYDFKVDWYRYDYLVDAKKALLKSSFSVHRHLGTKRAVEQVVQDYFGSGTVEEWFQYGGQPYHFKVNTDNPDLVNRNIQLFYDVLLIVKRQSAVLDAIEIGLYGNNMPYMGMAVRDATFEKHRMGGNI